MKDIEGSFYEAINYFLVKEELLDIPVIRNRYLDLNKYFNKVIIEVHGEKYSRYYEKVKSYNQETDLLKVTEKYNKTAILTIKAYGSNLVDDQILKALRRLNELFCSETLINRYINFACINRCEMLGDISFTYDNQRINAYSFDVNINYADDISADIEYIKKAPIDVKTIPKGDEVNITWEYKE